MMECTHEEVDMAMRSATLDRLHVCLATVTLDTPTDIFHALRDASVAAERWNDLDRQARAELHKHAGQLVERITHTRVLA